MASRLRARRWVLLPARKATTREVIHPPMIHGDCSVQFIYAPCLLRSLSDGYSGWCVTSRELFNFCTTSEQWRAGERLKFNRQLPRRRYLRLVRVWVSGIHRAADAVGLANAGRNASGKMIGRGTCKALARNLSRRIFENLAHKPRRRICKARAQNHSQSICKAPNTR